MKPTLFNLIIGVLGSLIVVIPFTGKLFDNRYKWYKRLYFRGWLIIIAFFLTIIITFLKDYQNEQDERNREIQVKKERLELDSINRKNEEKSKLEVINALAKYNLNYDAKHKAVIQLIRDSAKRIVNIKSDIQPILDISNIYLDSIRYPIHYIRVQLRCRKASAYNLLIKFYVLSETKNGFHFFKGNSDFLSKNVDLAVDMTMTTPPLELKEPDYAVKRFHFLFTGTYNNLEGKKIPFRHLLNYDLDDKRMGYMTEPYNSIIKEAFIKNGVE